jgi:putative DNA primase/helicase
MSTKAKSLKSRRKANSAKIVGEGRDEIGNRYFKFAVRGSTSEIEPISVDQLTRDPKPLFVALANAGWNAFTPQARTQFLQKLNGREPRKPTFRVVTRLGWNKTAYILPDEVTGEKSEQIVTAFSSLDQAMLRKYWVRGDLATWQEQIASLCNGNSRLMFAVSLAFTGPILRFAKGPKSGGFQIWGGGETGKTTAAMVAGSVWGRHKSEGRRDKGFVESWNTTPGKVEQSALAHNDTLLILDETKFAGTDDQQRARTVIDVTFKLAEQTERERMKQSPARAWRCFFLSTSNQSLRQLGEAGRVVVDDATIGRLADIPLPSGDHGIYEQLHRFASGKIPSDELQSKTRRVFGIAAREFVKKVRSEHRKNDNRPGRFLRSRRDAYLRKRRDASKDKNVQPLHRVSDRFATVYAAGSLAIKYKILPWKRKDLLRAILSCEIDQLQTVHQPVQDASVENLRQKLVQYIGAYRKQFLDLSTNRPRRRDHKFGSVSGYRDKFRGQNWCYAVFLTSLEWPTRDANDVHCFPNSSTKARVN